MWRAIWFLLDSKTTTNTSYESYALKIFNYYCGRQFLFGSILTKIYVCEFCGVFTWKNVAGKMMKWDRERESRAEQSLYSVCSRIERRADVSAFKYNFIYTTYEESASLSSSPSSSKSHQWKNIFLYGIKQSRFQPKNYTMQYAFHFISFHKIHVYPSIRCCVCSFIYVPQMYSFNVYAAIFRRILSLGLVNQCAFGIIVNMMIIIMMIMWSWSGAMHEFCIFYFFFFANEKKNWTTLKAINSSRCMCNVCSTIEDKEIRLLGK